MLYGLPSSRSLFERIASRTERLLRNRRRVRSLKGTLASTLAPGYLSTLELCRLIPGDGLVSIWDVGANRGTWTKLAVSLFPGIPIIAIEPIPKLYTSLSALRLPDVRSFQMALGASSGEGELHVTDNLDSSSLLSPTSLLESHYGVRETALAPCRVVRADTLIQSEQLPQPSLVKLDIQGFEIEALKGFGDTLSKVRYLIVELSFAEQYQGQRTASEVIAWLNEQGFVLSALSIDCATGIRLFETDALFERRA